MYCKKCGKKLDYGDKFCSGCGTNITPDIISPDPIDKKEDNFVEKKMTFKDFERDEKESIGKKVEANFFIEDFDWDLDGFPEERDTSEEDLEFDWNPVLEEKNKKKEEPKPEPVKEDISIESFADIVETPTREEIEHTILELGLGSTARIDREDLEAEEEILEEQAEDGEFEDSEESSSDVSLFDELEYEDQQSEEQEEQIEQPELPEEPEDRAPAIGVDKFYTFNQKNEEFQALLDQEYERLRKRLREESEAEELLNRKYERLERARNTWTMGELEIVDNQEDQAAEAVEAADTDSMAEQAGEEENKYLNEAIKTLKEETVELPKNDEIQKIIDSYAEENIINNQDEQDEALESREADNEFVEEKTDEVKEAESAPEVEVAENPVEPEVEAETSVDEKAEEDGVVEVVQPAKSLVVDETEKKEEPSVTDKTIVLPPKEQREKIKDMKAVAVVDYGDIFDDDEEEEVPLTRKEKKALKKAEKEREREEKKRKREEEKARKAGKSVEGADKADDAKAGDAEVKDLDVLEDGEKLEIEGEGEETKKSSKAGLILLDILIVVLTLVVCCAAIMAFAPDSFLGEKIGTGVEKVKDAVGIGYDSKKASEPAEVPGNPVEKMIKNASKSNENIGRIVAAEALTFSPSGDYAIKEVMQSVPFVDSVWHTDSDGNAVNYGDSIVKTTVKYYSDLVTKMTKGSNDILSVVVADTDFYKNLEKTKALGEDKFAIDTLKIGEIRSLDNNYFVLVEVTEKKDGEESTVKQLVQLIAQDKEMKINNVVEVK